MFVSYKRTFLWMAMMLLLHAVPGTALPKPTWSFNLPLDKIAHVGLFFILTVLAYYESVKLKGVFKLKIKQMLLILSFSLMWGLLLETMQHFIFVSRTFEVADLLADFIGVLFGFIICYYFLEKLIKLRS